MQHGVLILKSLTAWKLMNHGHGNNVEDYAEEVVTNFGDIPDNSLAVQYAMAFINEVAWAEIRDHVNEYLSEEV